MLWSGRELLQEEDAGRDVLRVGGRDLVDGRTKGCSIWSEEVECWCSRRPVDREHFDLAESWAVEMSSFLGVHVEDD